MLLFRYVQLQTKRKPYLTRFRFLESKYFMMEVNIFHQSDNRRFHNHTRNLLSFILWGSYKEEFPKSQAKIKRWINYIGSEVFHRLKVNKPVMTLCFGGRIRNNRFKYL